MKTTLRTAFAIGLFVLCSLVSVDKSPGADVHSCSVSFYAANALFTGRVTGSFRTSCPFARNVTRTSLKYIIRRGGAGDGDFHVFAWSPVTHRWYHTHCFANGDLYTSYGVHVRCTAGHGARVNYVGHSS